MHAFQSAGADVNILVTMVLLYLDGGQRMEGGVPLQLCLAVQRDHRFATAMGRRYLASDLDAGVTHVIGEVQCDASPEPVKVPTS